MCFPIPWNLSSFYVHNKNRTWILGCCRHKYSISKKHTHGSFFVVFCCVLVPGNDTLLVVKKSHECVIITWVKADLFSAKPLQTHSGMNLWIILANQISKFMGPTWGPPGSWQPQIGPMLAPWTLLSGHIFQFKIYFWNNNIFLFSAAHNAVYP